MDLNLITIIVLAVVLLVGVVTGITIGRNSSKANRLYDEAVRRAELAEAKLRDRAGS